MIKGTPKYSSNFKITEHEKLSEETVLKMYICTKNIFISIRNYSAEYCNHRQETKKLYIYKQYDREACQVINSHMNQLVSMMMPKYLKLKSDAISILIKVSRDMYHVSLYL